MRRRLVLVILTTLCGCQGPLAGGPTWWEIESKTYRLPSGDTVVVRAALQDDGVYLSQTRNSWAMTEAANVTSLAARDATRQRMAEICAPGKPTLLSETAREELYQRWRCVTGAGP